MNRQFISKREQRTAGGGARHAAWRAARNSALRLRRIAVPIAALLATASTIVVSGNALAATPNPYNAKITYWFFGEGDVPGINAWLQQRVKLYAKLHPQVHINLIPQAGATLSSTFALAAQSRTGPTIDTQYATLGVLAPLWEGQVSPISDFVPKSQTNHWLNTSENTYKGQIAAMPIYLIGTPLAWNKQLFKKAGLNPNVGPATWAQFLNDCKVLKAHGITPLGGGDKDGYFGAWMLSVFGKGLFNSTAQVTSAVAAPGTAETAFLSKLTTFYTTFASIVRDGYFNSNIASLTLGASVSLFPEKKVAMEISTDANVLSWAKILGAQNIGVERPPSAWTQGALSSDYDVTQSTSEFITSWSQDKPAQAAFLAWLHQPANLVALNKETGAFPADNRFPSKDISSPLARTLDELDTSGKSVWLENFLPPQVDTNADLPAGELIFSASGTPRQAAGVWETQLREWRTLQPTQDKQFEQWAKAS